MSVSLTELAGFSDDDPEVIAARAATIAYANLVEGLVELRHRRGMTQAGTDGDEVTTAHAVSQYSRY
jgi:hypothetical protein